MAATSADNDTIVLARCEPDNLNLVSSARPFPTLHETLKRIRHEEGPLLEFPQALLYDLNAHFGYGGVDDFSMRMWQKSISGLNYYDGRHATFLEKYTHRMAEVSRFGYDKFTQNTGKQIFVVTEHDNNGSGEPQYSIIYGPGNNPNYDSPIKEKTHVEKDGQLWMTQTWCLWEPIHLRAEGGRLARVYSNVCRATQATDVQARGIHARMSWDQSKKHNDDDHVDEATSYAESKGQAQQKSCIVKLKVRWRPAKRRKTYKFVRANLDQDSQPEHRMKLENSPQDIRTRESFDSFTNPSFDETIDIEDEEPSPEPQVGYQQPSKLEIQDDNFWSRDSHDSNISRNGLAGLMVKDSKPSLPSPAPSIVPPEPTYRFIPLPQEQLTRPTQVPRTQTDVQASITVRFQSKDNQELDRLPFTECNTAKDLFVNACACKATDIDTELMEVAVEGQLSERIKPGHKGHFEQKVLKMLEAQRYAGKVIEVVVKKYM